MCWDLQLHINSYALRIYFGEHYIMHDDDLFESFTYVLELEMTRMLNLSQTYL